MTDNVTQSTYDRIAGKFDERTAEMGQDQTRAAEQFAARLHPGGRVLDIGCGPGRDSFWMRAHGIATIGADLSAGMLQLAQSKGLGDLAQMDMLHLALPDRSVAGVWCNAALLHLQKEMAPHALAEFRRVLIAEGVLFLAVQEGSSEGYEPVTYVNEPLERFFARYQREEMEGMLQQSGFKIMEQSRNKPAVRTWLYFLASAEV